LVGGLVSVALGHNGVVGANTASNEIQNNRLLHPKEIDAIREMARRLDGTDGLSAAEWEARLGAQAMRQVSWTNDGLEDTRSRNLLERMVGTVGPLQDANGQFTVRAFYATPAQKLDDSLYLSSLQSNTEFYRRALTTSTFGVPARVRTPEEDARWRQIASNLTVAGAGVSLGLVAAGLAPEAIAWALSNPVAAQSLGLLTVEGAACIASGAVCPNSVVPNISAATARAARAGPALENGGQIPNSAITVYRVEGNPNTRLIIGEAGDVSIQGDTTLFLNFGDRARAEEFLATRISQGMPGATIRSFEVRSSLLDELRAIAVPESSARLFPTRPFIVDGTKAPNQLGLRPDQFQLLLQSILAGSGKKG
jgi:hypothetical protein